MKVGIDFADKKEYEKLDFLSQAIQDVRWGLVQEILDFFPEAWFMKITHCNEKDMLFSLMYDNDKLCDFFNHDSRPKIYGSLLTHLLSRFVQFSPPSSSGVVYKVDLLKEKFYLQPNETPVDGIATYKLPLNGYGDILTLMNDQFFNEHQYSYKSRNDKMAKRMRHIIRVFGGQETSDSCYICSRQLSRVLNKKLTANGDIDCFPIRNLDLYADMINSIKEYIDDENQIAYSKVCQYKLKISAQRPIYKVNFI